MENKVKDQLITENYAIYNGDCMVVMPSIKDESVDLSVYSPPFAGLYNYSSSESDFSNCESKEQFLQQYEYLIKEMARMYQVSKDWYNNLLIDSYKFLIKFNILFKIVI
jgi:DNA modification methylase